MATYLLTWNPDKYDWPKQHLDDCVARAGRALSTDFPWSTSRSKKAMKGDRVFLSKLGKAGRGLFAAGTVTKAGLADGDYGNSVMVRWERFLDPRIQGNLLDLTSTSDPVLAGQHWTPENSGISIRLEVVPVLDLVWGKHLKNVKANPGTEGTRGGIPPVLAAMIDELPEEERKTALRTIEVVLRSAALRPQVLKVWDPACAACGLTLADGSGNRECEVAHVHDVHAKGADPWVAG